MGKRGGKRGRGGNRGGGRGGGGGGQNTHTTDRVNYPTVPRSNELFEKYYNGLGIVSEEETSQFWEALRRDLPNSFRFTGSRGHALPVKQLLETRYIPEITAIEHEGRQVDPPTPIPWYPDQLAWQMTTPKNIIRRFPPFASFQKFLVSETSTGNISRQEVVSMIPPLLMNLKPGMTVLDLCAAPGSKSAQLIEMVHSGEEARMRSVVRKLLQEDGRELTPDGDEVKLETENGGLADDWSDEGRATGLLIANDVEYRRAHMLIHQMKRLNSPNLIVTNHDATMFPSIKLPSDSSDSKAPNKYLKFDRILADVPCSGDGTPRKNVNVWKDWSPVNGLGLHVTQVRILVRSLQMLKVGGRVVYSTCSMNPIENESVVAAAIERCGGMEKVDVLDCSSELPELKRSSGLKSWPVMDKRGGLWNTWKEVEERKASGDYPDYIGKLSEEMFPPSESDNIPLERCMRVYPHQQDTGGFFITVLEKKSEIKARPANVAKGEFHKKPQTEAAKSELPAPEAAPITATLNELESKAGGNNPGEHIEALDALAPSTADDAEISNASAAQRQNMEHVDEQEKNPRKHALYDEADAAAAVKKPKFREEIDAPAERGEEDRQIHYPPPPSNPPQPAERSAGGGNEPSNENQSSLAPKGDKKKQPQQFEEPFKYLDPNHEVIDTIYDFYKIHPRFPRDRFMVRNAMGTPVKTIYYTSTLAKQILTENEGKGMKFVHCGVKMFVKQDVQSEEVCRWRLQTEGIPLLEAWVGEERVIRLHSRKTFRYLLVEMFPKVTGNGHLDLGEIGKRALQMSMGCCVLRIEKGEGEDSFKERMVLPIWRSMHSLNLMLPKEDRKATLLRLYNDTTPLADHSKDRFKQSEPVSEAIIGQEASTAHVADTLEPDEAEEKEEVAAEQAADEEMDVDEEDGGVLLPNADVEEAAEIKADVKVGTLDEEDVKDRIKADGEL